MVAVPAGFLGYTLRRFIRDGCLSAAGALSYTTLVSLVPLIAIAFAILAAFPIFAATRDKLLADLFGKFVPAVGAEMDYWFRYFADTAVKTTALGVVALGITVVLLLATIEDQLQIIWHVRSSRPWVQRILVYWAIITLGPVLLGVAFSLPAYVSPVAQRTGLVAGALLAAAWARPLVELLPFVLETVVFTLIYGLIPNCRVRWREAAAGGLVAAALIDALKVGFVLYIASLSSYRAVYGALAAIPIFLLWMYIVWAAVLFGAVVAAALPRWRGGRDGAGGATGVARLGLGLALVGALADQRRQGGAVAEARLAERLGVAAAEMADDLALLQRAGFIVPSVGGGWVLARALDSVTLLDFHRALALPLASGRDAAETYARQPRIAVTAPQTASSLPRTR
jgi:membrane protein